MTAGPDHHPRQPELLRGHPVGIDLDLTLIDTREATGFALRRVNRELGVSIDVAEFLARLGPPIHGELARWVAEERLEAAVAAFRRCFATEGLAYLRPLPGAAELLQWTRAHGGRLVVITSRIPEIAQACLHACGLPIPDVVGGVAGAAKAPAMRDHRVCAYVGDHPLDMAGAAAAGVPGIGVTTGNHGEAELVRAGATRVVPTLRALVG
jgi:phosphoglycolate phosphatase